MRRVQTCELFFSGPECLINSEIIFWFISSKHSHEIRKFCLIKPKTVYSGKICFNIKVVVSTFLFTNSRCIGLSIIRSCFADFLSLASLLPNISWKPEKKTAQSMFCSIVSRLSSTPFLKYGRNLSEYLIKSSYLYFLCCQIQICGFSWFYRCLRHL